MLHTFIKSLFIGVVYRGMMATYLAMDAEAALQSYTKHHEENTMPEVQARLFQQQMAKENGHQYSHGYLTLKEKIEKVFEENLKKHEYHQFRHLSKKWAKYYENFVFKMIEIRDSAKFVMFITFTIVVVAIVAAYQTNHNLKCDRLFHRIGDEDDISSKEEIEICETIPHTLYALDIISQTIFTTEAFIKIAAEGTDPWNYFNDPTNGPWNKVDFTVVLFGFVDYTPLEKHFSHSESPVVLLRLLRLLRVFRLAKALPRLRSIVEALVSAMASVGWICLLFSVFNYIVACMCIIMFRTNVNRRQFFKTYHLVYILKKKKKSNCMFKMLFITHTIYI
jgi:hypothetical protein